MKPRECPFCGKKPEKYRSTWYVCKKCEIDVPVEVWDYRHDDWRSDGFPEKGNFLVLFEYSGKPKVGMGSLDRGKVSVCGYAPHVSTEECKWKPLPESEGA